MVDSKFKVWHKRANIMYHNVLIGQMGAPLIYIYESNLGDWVKVDPKECMVLQSTGIVDKNGIDVFEGDILKVYDDFFREGIDDKYGTVIYDKGKFHLNTFKSYYNDCWVYFEIVGNIFENKGENQDVVK